MLPGRSRARNSITFDPAITGPTGSQILAYSWAWKAVDVVDGRGEGRVRRVSDWDRAVESEATGREIVHQFTVRCPLGHVRALSLESALRDLGLVADSTAPGRGAIAAARTLGRLLIERDALAAALDRVAAAETQVDALPQPRLPDAIGADGWAHLPDAPEVRVMCWREGLTQERFACLRQLWTESRVRSLLAAQDCTEKRSARELRSDLVALDARIAKAEGRVAVATAAAAPGLVGAVLNKRTHGVPAGAIYIGRPSPYGNRFQIGPDGDRESVIAKYRDWLMEHPELIARAQRELLGKALVCWCAPEACHGDVLRSVVNAAQAVYFGSADAMKPAAGTSTGERSNEHARQGFMM